MQQTNNVNVWSVGFINSIHLLSWVFSILYARADWILVYRDVLTPIIPNLHISSLWIWMVVINRMPRHMHIMYNNKNGMVDAWLMLLCFALTVHFWILKILCSYCRRKYLFLSCEGVSWLHNKHFRLDFNISH